MINNIHSHRNTESVITTQSGPKRHLFLFETTMATNHFPGKKGQLSRNGNLDQNFFGRPIPVNVVSPVDQDWIFGGH